MLCKAKTFRCFRLRPNVFRPTDYPSDSRGCNHIRVGQVSVSLAHPARHIAIGGRNGRLALLGPSRSGVDTGATSRLINHLHAGSQQSLMDTPAFGFVPDTFRSVLDKRGNLHPMTL